MKNLHYILDERGEPKAEPDLYTWAMWLAETQAGQARLVARTDFPGGWVSTVFLGLDHNWRPDGPPILWETMVFGGPHDQEQWRCAGSREQALAQHERVCREIGVKVEA